VLDRRPELALVDELARQNLPGERHAKRWQDVGDMLASGIDVYATLNVANIESLGPAVAQIAGAQRAEPVPDAFVRSARSSSSTWRPRRCRAGWPGAWSSPRSNLSVQLVNVGRPDKTSHEWPSPRQDAGQQRRT
jgi:Osmosensitive K+ channel His kinase sensor domain